MCGGGKDAKLGDWDSNPWSDFNWSCDFVQLPYPFSVSSFEPACLINVRIKNKACFKVERELKDNQAQLSHFIGEKIAAQ